MNEGDWRWIEETCGVILPRVPFRKMVLCWSEFLEFWICCKNTDGRRCRGCLAGAFSFSQKKKKSPFKKTRILQFRVLPCFFERGRFVQIKPCQATATPSSELVFTKNQKDQRTLTKIIPFSEKVREAK